MTPAVSLGSVVRIPLSRLDPKGLAQVERALTFRSDRSIGFGGDSAPKVYEAFRRGPDFIDVPRNWPAARRLLDQGPYEDLRSDGQDVQLEFKGTFRPGQELYVHECLQALARDDMGILGRAPCGFGKTFCAMAVIARVRRSTLIVVHKDFLMKQWAAACRTLLGVEPGFVQSDRCDYKGKAVVIAMVQSLAQRDYGADFYNSFGLVVTDEAHRVSAPTWADAVMRFPARYRFGCTATPRRGDRMENVFFWHIGDIGAVGRGDFLDCIVYRVMYNPQLEESDYFFRGRPSLSRLVNRLVAIEDRTDMLVRVIAKAARAERRPMVLSDRVDHLVEIEKKLQAVFTAERRELAIGHYAAGTTKKARRLQDDALKANVLLATWTMAAEGMDVPQLDTLVMATPKADTEQGQGRIRRKHPDKKPPMIVDVVDDVPMLRGFAYKRLNYYTSQDIDKTPWQVHDV